MKQIIAGVVIGALACAVSSAAQSANSATPGPTTVPGISPVVQPIIHIDDVARFYKVYEAAGGHPTADQLQRDYIDPGSEGLHHLAKVRNVSGTTIAKTLAEHPEIYSDAKHCMAVLPSVRERVEVALRKLGSLYPEARFPPVTIVVGRGKPVAIGGPTSGIQIGLEALCATDWLNPNVEERFVHVIAHEYTHVQQSPALTNNEHPTVLDLSLIEGTAEFTGELISGDVAYSNFRVRQQGAKKKSRRPSSRTKTRPTSPTGFRTARGRSRATLAIGSDIGSSNLTTSIATTSAERFARSWR